MIVAGFQSIGDTGSYQVDSTFANLALERSGTVISQVYTNGETTNTSPTRASITIEDGEILALSCNVLCCLGSRVGNVGYLYADGPAGQVINYYVFKPGHNAISNLGMQIFDGSEKITFDSGWNLFDVRSLFKGYGTVSMPPGRKYAVVQSQIGNSILYVKVVNGMAPNYLTSYIRTTSFSAYRVQGQIIDCALTVIDIAGTRPQRSGAGNSFSQTYANGVEPSALIIDVTGM